MRVMLLTGLLSAACTTGAFAAPTLPETTDCQIEESRGQVEERRVQAPPQQTARTTSAREDETSARPAAPQRRRNGKQIPDAELMAPRALL